MGFRKTLKKSTHGLKSRWIAGRPLSLKDWESYRARLTSECLKCNIQPEDYYLPVDFPLLIDHEEWLNLAKVAEKLSAEALAAERELLDRTDLHRRLGLPASIREVLRERNARSAPTDVARYMRFDFHLTPEGWRISEGNGDTVGGFMAGSLFSESMAPYFPQFSPPPDPVSAHARAIRQAVGEKALVAIVRRRIHARYYEEKYLARELQRQGMRAVIVSPGELSWKSKVAKIANSSASDGPGLLVRWLDGYWLPRLRPGSQWKLWFSGSRTPLSNPGTCMLTQSKRFPLVWDDLNTSMSAWRSQIPETRCPSELRSVSEAEWVLKPAFGHGGSGIAIPGISSRRSYKKAAREAKRHPLGWVAQRRFEAVAVPTEQSLRHVCLGIFTVAGRAAGAYARIATKALIDHTAKDIAVLIRREN